MKKNEDKPQLSETQINKILAQVVLDVKALTKSIAKAEPGAEAPSEKDPEGSSVEPAAPKGDAPPEETPGEDHPPDEETPGEDAPPAAPPADAAPPAADPAAETAMTPETLEGEYSQLPPDELKMHFLACKAALMATMKPAAAAPAPAPGADPAAASTAPPTPPPPPAPPADGPPTDADPPAPKDDGPPVQKSESDDVVALRKTVDDQAKMIADMNANFALMTKGLQKLAGGGEPKPLRKSVRGIEDVKVPPAQMDFSVFPKEVMLQKINERIESGVPLSKSDKDLIRRFNCGNTVSNAEVAHLVIK